MTAEASVLQLRVLAMVALRRDNKRKSCFCPGLESMRRSSAGDTGASSRVRLHMSLQSREHWRARY